MISCDFILTFTSRNVYIQRGYFKPEKELKCSNILQCWGSFSMWVSQLLNQTYFPWGWRKSRPEKGSASNNQFTPSSELPVYHTVKVTVNPWGLFWPSLIMPCGIYMLWKLNHNSHRQNGKLVKQTFPFLIFCFALHKQGRNKLEI